MTPFTIYCDSLSDELLAKEWLTGGGPLGTASIERLPSFANAPDFLRPLLSWERLDWVVCREDAPVAAVEFSRHGYTGDNSFQRFARLFRAVSLRVPVIYFTAFARARLNELDEGRNSPRNVAPELFQTMERLSRKFDAPCLGVNWPVSDGGTPAPLTSPAVAGARAQLVALVKFFCEHDNPGSNMELVKQFPDTVRMMEAQAALPYRGSQTRGQIGLPLDIGASEWVRNWLPYDYFSRGKADKILASAALRLVDPRPIQRVAPGEDVWGMTGHARVLFLGYQWRPDPACGLIALSAANAAADDQPLIVVWPRVFRVAGDAHDQANKALMEFQLRGTGPLLDEGVALGFDSQDLGRFRTRLSIEGNQYGLYSTHSKIDRILRDTASAVVLADLVLAMK